MTKRKTRENKVAVGNITDVSGELNIAAGDINQTFNTIHPRALTAAEEAARARKLLTRGVNLNQVGAFYERNETKRGSFE